MTQNNAVAQFKAEQQAKFKQATEQQCPHYLKLIRFRRKFHNQQLQQQKMEIDQRNHCRRLAFKLIRALGALPKAQAINDDEDQSLSQPAVVTGTLNQLLVEHPWLSDEIQNGRLKLEDYPEIIKEWIKYHELYNAYQQTITPQREVIDK